jgi:hypothetical protein
MRTRNAADARSSDIGALRRRVGSRPGADVPQHPVLPDSAGGSMRSVTGFHDASNIRTVFWNSEWWGIIRPIPGSS